MSHEYHDVPRMPRGFRCASRNCGLKPQAADLAIFVSDVDAAAAAVFTRNRFPGAPIILGR
jgi:glutamate N-acetyltransferase / amino-acid N-acetyltransferase